MGKHDPPFGADLRRRDRRLIFWTFWTCLWLVVMLTFLTTSVSEWTGWDPARDYQAAGGAAFVAVLTAALAALGGRRVVRLYRNGILVLILPGPARAQTSQIDRRPRRSNARSSAAKTPMARLDRAEARLDDLLHQLDESGAPADWVNDARTAAAVAAGELRTVAAKLESVEQAMVSAPAAERAELRAGVNRLRGRIDEGLERYGRLIAAAGQALIASAAVASAGELTDATDHLAGLGEALREVSKPF